MAAQTVIIRVPHEFMAHLERLLEEYRLSTGMDISMPNFLKLITPLIPPHIIIVQSRRDMHNGRKRSLFSIGKVATID